MAPMHAIGIHAFWLWSAAVAGVALDYLLGEPRRAHPLVGFGRLAGWLERTFNRPDGRPGSRLLLGACGWCALVLPPAVAAQALVMALPLPLALLVHALLLYFTLGAQSLGAHVRPIAAALAAGDLPAARALTARIVSRDLDDADEAAVARAAVESTLENGNDAIFGALFWFAVAGGPGALAYRLANTLDAMWGYRTPRLLHFGRVAARADDVLNWLPARLTAISYALLGHSHDAFACWKTQARHWDSPNAGPVMAAGAGSLGVCLGGPARYHGHIEDRPPLGCGETAGDHHITEAWRLVVRTQQAWLAFGAILPALTLASLL